MAFREIAIGALALCLAGCGRPAEVPAPGEWSYDVTFPESVANGHVMVEARFVNVSTTTFRIRPEIAPLVRDLRVDRGTVVKTRDSWILSGCVRACTLRYTIEVLRAVHACADDLGCAVGVEGAALAPITTWLVRPSPRRDMPARVRLHGAYESGLRQVAAQPLRSIDLDEGSFVAFGKTRRSEVDGLAVVVLGESPAADDIVRSALGSAVSSFSALRTLAPKTFVFNSRGEARGKVMALSGASVALDSGEEGNESRERVALHELAHFTVPTFRGEGRWVGEGVAVYFEALMRAQSGALAPDALVQHLRTVVTTAPQRPVLAMAEDDDSIYAGGALFALTLDLELRARCRSLPDAVRAAMTRGANATRVMRVRDYFALLSVVSGSDVPLDLYQRVAVGGERVDVSSLVARLAREPWLDSPMIPKEHARTGAKHCADVP